MRILLDTHAFLWFLGDGASLGARVLEEVTKPEHELLLSAVSWWELCLKLSVGKLALEAGWPERFAQEMRTNGIGWLPITREHILGIVDLPWHHRDPFDRLLVAQATKEAAVIATHTPAISLYGVPTIW